MQIWSHFASLDGHFVSAVILLPFTVVWHLFVSVHSLFPSPCSHFASFCIRFAFNCGHFVSISGHFVSLGGCFASLYGPFCFFMPLKGCSGIIHRCLAAVAGSQGEPVPPVATPLALPL